MRILMLVIAAALLLAAGGGGAYYLLSKQQATVAELQKTQFFPLERFVISVDSAQHSRYLVLELTLLSHNSQVMAQLPDATPLLRNALVEHFSNVSHSEVKSGFKDIPAMQQALLDKFNHTLRQHSLSYQLEQVLVTNVFIQ
ncbi:MAG: flagellar basal body-associated FliL family protein [Gammaproteobacteria bacterium]|nr:flagellar basal body-associated FliL family protein [Gammaproteobacteria bacterium]MBU1553346.1 flagellar basal body-associated FliL family protein [Gammaproteobacteria bacterium]MBU2070790.1 flagellar basal body-associated FliL family protein [Gammaproteobacteria bacterium]MBU2182781.1 flagellar basal body-associated FliL family protein [Gammaproteobacteria bacterium]MBU2205977.1 flagellar basal body-associated FliL family protein [Gammaproteobacteria bacterium]